jgi:hypothetical protein
LAVARAALWGAGKVFTEQQNALFLAGNDRGIYGDYPTRR